MVDRSDETTQSVRRQYEEFPYPERDPQDERKRLVSTCLSRLDVINHYGYKGRRNFLDGFRVLVAGGGTGDATIFLAEQLKHTDARVVYVDLSEPSMEIARRRAEVRGLENITWIHGSLLDLPAMDLPAFDYVECSGVLHHLADPAEGLRTLRGMLADGGVMFVMVYAKYGRTGVYQVQELMRRINDEGDDGQAKVANTRAVLDSLPPTNWFKRGEGLFHDQHWASGAGVYDLFLHSQDRPFTVGELYEWLDACGLHLITFGAETRALYKPETHLSDERLLARIGGLPIRQQEAIGELLSGLIRKHAFLASPREGTEADLQDRENIPFFPEGLADPRLVSRMLNDPTWVFQAPVRPNLNITPGAYTRAVFRHLNGQRSTKEILRLAARDFPHRPSRNEIMAQFEPVFHAMREWGDFLLLRHPSSRR
ncbi:MAG TPA: class I SAM-dependent methyltransferase [Phycisphaerae bacterium]|nr:class I SAM-dependent methyltransferase [Phycisphaerae bacterium]